jgi:hypothetical protein
MSSKQSPDKRQTHRFPLQLPVAVTEKKLAGKTETENISSGGVMFYVNEDVDIGATIAFTICMPAKVLGAPKDVTLKCKGRVVRCDRVKRRRAVAVVIDEYEFERG